MIDEIKVKKLLLKYRDIIEELRNLGVIRTGKVVSDYGEYWVSKKLGLILERKTNNKGFDATDKKGKKYEIKARKANSWNKPGIFLIRKEQLKHSDFVIYVEFNNDWNVEKLLKIPSNKVRANKDKHSVTISKELIRKYSMNNQINTKAVTLK